MFDIGDWVYGLFGGSLEGILLCVFLVFLIDALAFPTLPELFFIGAFMAEPTVLFGLEILLVAILAEVIGISLLYYIVEHIRVPERIKRIADRYVKFLIVSDERMLLVNRIAPMIPFAGAFVSLIDEWRLSKALFYVVLGCIIKYGAMLLMSGFFYTYFDSGVAQTFSLIFTFAVIVISLMLAFYKKKRSGLNENS